jgi:CRISPR-associated protein Csx10
MTAVNKKLRIILKSDLCAGSGFSYAGIVDSDVSYNKNGIPFISGRRLKGCMKEAAELIGVPNLAEIFGIRGNDRSMGIFIGNAFPEHYVDSKDELDEIQTGNNEYADYLNRQNILEMQTQIKAQTKIGENGAALDNTLRFTRTIDQFDKIQKKDMVFEAEVSYEYEGEKDPIKDNLDNIVAATRNIGMNRNRGLGSVKMQLVDDTKRPLVTVKDSSVADGRKKISYSLINVQPLLMSSSKNNISDHYISGTSVLGAFAGEYLKDKDADSAEFRALFLEHNVIFSNLTLDASYPAPLYINQLKKTKKLVNTAADIPEGDLGAYSPADGNQPKKLKTQFIRNDDGKYEVKEVKKEIIYHHTKKARTSEGKEEILYFLEAIEENQRFCGEIIVKNEYLEIVEELLKKITFRFGKSKSAQYGMCRLEPDSVVVTDYHETVKTEKIKKGTRVLVTFLSDGIFVNDQGIYTVQHEEVRNLIGKELGLSTAEEDTKSYIQTKALTGFYTKWNLKKQEIPVIQAGSAFEYTLEADLTEYKEYIGERNSEGFGKISIFPLDGAAYCLERVTEKKTEKKEIKSPYLKELLYEIVMKKLYIRMKEKAFYDKEIKITPAALGRLTLMLTEAENEAEPAIDQYILLRSRIDSIKSKDTQAEIMRFLEEVLGKAVEMENRDEKTKNGLRKAVEPKDIDEKTKNKQKDFIIDKLRKNKNGDGDIEEYQFLMEHFDEKKVKEDVFSLWNRYFRDVLVYQKYLKK